MKNGSVVLSGRPSPGRPDPGRSSEGPELPTYGKLFVIRVPERCGRLAMRPPAPGNSDLHEAFQRREEDLRSVIAG
jgi:hypothetical protein